MPGPGRTLGGGCLPRESRRLGKDRGVGEGQGPGARWVIPGQRPREGKYSAPWKAEGARHLSPEPLPSGSPHAAVPRPRCSFQGPRAARLRGGGPGAAQGPKEVRLGEAGTRWVPLAAGSGPSPSPTRLLPPSPSSASPSLGNSSPTRLDLDGILHFPGHFKNQGADVFDVVFFFSFSQVLR